jgi:hypothetical protein
MKWRMYSRSEVDRLTAVPQPPDNPAPRKCPVCQEPTIRHYYHDYKSSGSPIPSGTSWFWCPHCARYASFTGPTLQYDFYYDDPLKDQIELIPEAQILDRLNSAWDSGGLPQTFTRRR